MDLLTVLKTHKEKYPAMVARDAAKLIYQAVLGPGHLGRAGTPKVEYIAKEMASAAKRDIPLCESIGNGIVRLNLDSIHNQLRPETVHHLFLHTAKAHTGSLEQLKEQLALFAESDLFPAEDISAELQKLQDSDYAPVSHSQPYHEAYDPHYRLILEEFTTILPLLTAIDLRLQGNSRTLLAIDGRCAGGKSTLAAFLEELYGCDVIHMDDFFLPFERKTAERLAEAGGNVDRERFYQEVILPYESAEPITYGVYDCSCGQITRLRSAAQTALLIVEGSYCLHPLMAKSYDLKVFVSCESETQSQRILARDGEVFYRRFVEEWIPMEEHYFKEFDIEKSCDFKINT